MNVFFANLAPTENIRFSDQWFSSSKRKNVSLKLPDFPSLLDSASDPKSFSSTDTSKIFFINLWVDNSLFFFMSVKNTIMSIFTHTKKGNNFNYFYQNLHLFFSQKNVLRISSISTSVSIICL